MGLIKAITGAAGGVLADQWKEMIYCDAIPADTLMVKGQKRVSGRSSNTKASDNIITNGSAIVVNDGQAMIIVDQGKIVEFCAEPGQFTYNSSSEPSIFTGDLEQGIRDSIARVGERFAFGGDTGHDQRVYYFNIKEIVDNKYGTPTPVPFRVIDRNIGLDVDISVRCNGVYSYKIVDPVLFYSELCGNVSDRYLRSEIEGQMKSELLTALQPAFAVVSAAGVRYSEIPAHTIELCDALNDVLSEKWTRLRGIKIVSFGVNSIAASEEDQQMIKDLQKSATMRDPRMAAAVLTGAQADAMRAAAANEAGAMTGFMGMGMAAGAVGNQAANLYAMAEQPVPTPVAAPAPAPAPAPAAGGWTCECGNACTGKFCPECGKPKPEPTGWTCACGNACTGKFCPECGSPKPTAPRQYKCSNCGWIPEDPTNPHKFCPQCGDRFDEGDAVS